MLTKERVNKIKKEIVKKSGQMAVPVIDIDGQITVGFDRARLFESIEEKP
ncbi:MAG: hypothetical protein HY001_02425 [Candidatus Portnoybacteria bacterium]|nr:hypothetical protein [Candidatus Portnoybacteria bacterium]